MSDFKTHPSKRLQAVFAKRPFQMQEPEKAHIIFLGLDANFAEELADDDHKELLQEFIDYLEDGVSYWKTTGFHTPMLQPYYPFREGKRYHQNFRKLGFTPDDTHDYAQDICFLELLNICTCGRSTTRDGTKEFRRLLHSAENQSHLKRIEKLANDKSKQIYVCGRSKKTKKIFRELNRFDINFDINAENVFIGTHFSAPVTNMYLEKVGQALKNFLLTGAYVPKDLETN